MIAHNCAAHLAPGGRLTINATTASFAADLIGGLVSWIDDGHPVVPAPDDEVFQGPAEGR